MKKKPLYIETWLARRDLKPTRVVVVDGKATLFYAPDVEARAWRGDAARSQVEYTKPARPATR